MNWSWRKVVLFITYWGWERGGREGCCHLYRLWQILVWKQVYIKQIVVLNMYLVTLPSEFMSILWKILAALLSGVSKSSGWVSWRKDQISLRNSRLLCLYPLNIQGKYPDSKGLDSLFLAKQPYQYDWLCTFNKRPEGFCNDKVMYENCWPPPPPRLIDFTMLVLVTCYCGTVTVLSLFTSSTSVLPGWAQSWGRWTGPGQSSPPGRCNRSRQRHTYWTGRGL